MSDEARCPQCGTPYTPADEPTRCANCGADLPPAVPAEAPKPLEIEGWFQEPAAGPQPPPVPPPVEELILLDAPPEEPPAPPPVVPVVQRAAVAPQPPTARVAPPARLDDLPEARRMPRWESRPVELVRPPLPPVRETAPPNVPKPRVYLALFVLLGVFVAMGCGMTVIAYAIWAGFSAAAKQKTEAPVVVAPVRA